MKKMKAALPLPNMIKKRWMMTILYLLVSVGLLVGCSSSPEVIEVTRVVSEEVQVTVEVAQITTVEVPVEITVEVPIEVPVEVQVEVEVTRLIEVIITPTPLPTEEATAVPTETPTPEATAVVEGSNYTIQTGDTLAKIATVTGVSVTDIMAANNLTNQNLLIAGQQLLIPGWDGSLLAEPTVVSQGTAVAPTSPVAATGQNLLPNASFEEDWYFFNGVSELQIPVGWLTYTDEGLNPFTDDPDDVFLRPEIRVVPSEDMPASEAASFIFDGNKTIKAFKGGAPTHFGIFTDIALPAGSYRFTANFFPDIVTAYNGGNKIWATDPLSAEARIVFNDGGTTWAPATVGAKNTLTYDFVLTQPATVRIGAAFRNRYVNHNNGWFLDDWVLQRLGG